MSVIIVAVLQYPLDTVISFRQAADRWLLCRTPCMRNRSWLSAASSKLGSNAPSLRLTGGHETRTMKPWSGSFCASNNATEGFCALP